MKVLISTDLGKRFKETKSAPAFPKKDGRALAARLELLIRDPDLREAMGRRGRELYKARYSLEQFHARVEQAFLSLDSSTAPE